MFEDTARLAANMVERDLKNSGQVGYTEKNVFTFDGNTEGRLQFPFYPLYKISNKVPDISTLVKLTANMGGVEYELAAEYCTILTGELGAIIQVEVSGTLVEVARIINTAGDASEEYIGLYAISTEQGYLAAIEFAETIHPINPKYLPGVCLPKVIDLDTYGDTPVGTILGTLMASGGGQERATGIDGLFADLDTDSPVVFKFTVSGVGSIGVSGATIVKEATKGVTGFSFQCITVLNNSLTRVSVIMDRTGAILETIESVALSG